MFKKFSNTNEDKQYIAKENVEFNNIFNTVCAILGKRTFTDSQELLQFGKKYIGKKFIGVFPYDMIPLNRFKIGTCMIINTDPHNMPGEHWVAIYRAGPRLYYFFDSYGDTWDKNIPNLKFYLNKGADIMSVKTIRQHGDHQSFCGQVSLSYLIYLYQQPKPEFALVV